MEEGAGPSGGEESEAGVRDEGEFTEGMTENEGWVEERRMGGGRVS